ncbi:hypothetical protein AB0D94_28740 [Streptomyces sp. NPDC048255]|uniref:WD40 repeat domain-containing protein n=1 Tax=Streptomyces sp. NPDC048255 TaxID=3154713 RepID=UPI0034095DA0
MSDLLEPGRHTEIHRRIAAALAELVPDDPSLPPHPYLRRHLAEHAARGQVLDDAHVPPALLPWESSLEVRRLLAAGDAGSAGSPWLRAWARLEPFSRNVDPLSRATSLGLAHHAAGAQAGGTQPPAPEAFAQAPVTPVWSEGCSPDSVWLVTQSRATALTTVEGTGARYGPLVVAGDGQGQLHTLRRDGSTARAPLHVHRGAVTHLLALPGSGLVATGSTDGSVAVVDVLQGRLAFEAVPRRPRTWVSSLALYRPAGHTPVLLAAFSDGHLAALHPAVFHPADVALPLLSGDSPLLCAVASPGGEQLLLFTRNDEVHGFDGHTTQLLSRHGARVRTLVALPAPGQYAVADEQGQVSVHRADRPTEPGPSVQHGQRTSVTSLMVTEVDGHPGLLSAGGDGTVCLWRLPDLASAGRQLTAHTESVTALSQVGLTRPRLVTAGADCTVRSWPLTTRTFRNAPRAWDRITASALCPSAPYVLATARVRRINVRNIRTTDEPRTVLTGHTATALAWTRVNGKLHLAAALEDNRIILIDPRRPPGDNPAFRPAYELAGHFQPALALVPLPGADTDLLASASTDGRVCVWDLRTEELLAGFPDHRFSVRCLATHRGREGVLLASGGSDGNVRLWDVRRLTQHGPTIKCGQHFVNGLAIGQAGDQELLVASAGQDATLKVWNAGSGEQTGQFSPGDGELSAVAALALPTGHSLFAAAGKTSIHVWDPSANRRLLQIVTGESITRLETVPDRESNGGSLLLATGETCTMLFRLHHDRI